MATATQIALAEYLETSYRPDRDYLDGELVERNVGETPHSGLQIFLGFYFRGRRDAWHIRAFSEQRVQIAPNRFRIPDLCLVSLEARIGLILVDPPILCIEILSREDRMIETHERIDDYLRMGVGAVWIIDPSRRKAFYATPDGSLLHEPETLRVPNSPIELPVAAIFEELDALAIE